MGIICAVIALIVAFVSFYQWGKWANCSSSIKSPYEALKPDGSFQRQFQEKDYVVQFASYLTQIARKDYETAWKILANEQAIKYGDDKIDGFKRDYTFTDKYDVHYYIPIEEHEAKARFYVYFTFIDALNALPNLQVARSCKIENANQLISPELVAEVKEVLVTFYRCDGVSDEQLQSSIRLYLEKLTLRNFIYFDWRFIVLLAYDMQLQQKEKPDKFKSRINHPIRILSEVTMEKHAGAWYIQDFTTIAIERWGGNVH